MDAIQEASAESLREESAGASNSQQPSAVYYNGIFSIANRERLLRTSMTAQVFIITAQAKNVLRVPLSALGSQQSDKRYRVQVIQDKQTVVREVLLGLRNDQYAEVKEGLQQGDQVVLMGAPSGVINAR